MSGFTIRAARYPAYGPLTTLLDPPPTSLLDDCQTRDVPGLRHALARLPAAERVPERLPEALAERFRASRAATAQRRASRPRPSFPEDLPIVAECAALVEAIAEHPVTIVCGETGSGKTTQLPKICLEAGRGVRGLIGHTQPRRIAARATAERIAFELASPLGDLVGYKIRFTDRTRPGAYIKVMTDGMLLAEIQGDPELSAYDTLIIDEAHERSVNIDFLLGYLCRLLRRRPDLRLIVTSATLDAGHYARFFGERAGCAPVPVFEVSGRLHPIEIRWRPPDTDTELADAIVDAVHELTLAGPGDVLVFLPGEREIRETERALRQAHAAASGPRPEILPLYARQSAREQAHVFNPGRTLRVVLATNVAETSLTVPGIRYVIDTGLARIKRYSPRNKVEQLHVEPIAQSAARQRAGRCGRVAAGICIRLYAEDDFLNRPMQTDPEILRCSLAGVILRMKALGLGRIEDFALLDPPSPRQVQDGHRLLAELGAIDDSHALTPLGRELARLPLDPKIGRMLLAARAEGCLSEMLAIVSALAAGDARERADESRRAGGEWAALQDERSEFLAYCKLWNAFDQVWRERSSRQQRDWCRQLGLSHRRMREWRDLHAQLGAQVAEFGWRPNVAPADYGAVHRALLAGLLGHIGVKSEDGGHYLGANGIRFLPHPGSALARKAGRWIMAAELVETSRLYARTLARIEPDWIEQVGAHLVRRTVEAPHWEKRSGQAIGLERGVLYGLTLYARRPVAYARIDRALARTLLLREALVAGEVTAEVLKQLPFLRHNLALVAEIRELEERRRRPDLLVDEEQIFDFYDRHIPESVFDVRSLIHWCRSAAPDGPGLELTRAQLLRHEVAGTMSRRFPPAFVWNGQSLPLSYRHEPGASDDGVTLDVPLALLNQIPEARCAWLVPGMLEDKVQALVRTLSPSLRQRLQALPAFAAEFVREFVSDRVSDADATGPDSDLLTALAEAVRQRTQQPLTRESFREERLPDHLRMNFRVLAPDGRVLGQGRALSALRARLGKTASASFSARAAAAPAAPRTAPTTATDEKRFDQDTRHTGWTFGPLPETLALNIDGVVTTGFPAIEDVGDGVRIVLCESAERAQRLQRLGLLRLFRIALKEAVRQLEKSLTSDREFALATALPGGVDRLSADVVACALARTCLGEPWPDDAERFAARVAEARGRIVLVGQELIRLVRGLLAEHAQLRRRLVELKAFGEAVRDIDQQLRGLFAEGFLVEHGYEHVQHYARYLRAMAERLDKLARDPARDARLMAQWQALARPWERACAELTVADASLVRFRWMLEELRVHLFAQALRTPYPVSAKRLGEFWEKRPR
ncbi:MAG: ATP-dependent helicase [Betaproteobacteria bacterium]